MPRACTKPRTALRQTDLTSQPSVSPARPRHGPDTSGTCIDEGQASLTCFALVRHIHYVPRQLGMST